MKNSSAVIM